MDHLQLPRHPIRPLPAVRIYAKEEFDGGPFLTYLDRIGWSEQELVAWFSPRTSDEIHAVLQTWTYFGLLSAVLGRPVLRAQLARSPNAGEGYGRPSLEDPLILTTRDLRPMAYEWVERESRLPKSKRLEDEEHMRLCLEKVWHIYDALGMGRQDHNALDSYFCFSVQVLCEFLIAMHKFAFHPPGIEYPRFSEVKIFLRSISYATDQLFSDLHTNGWCKAETRSMRKLSPSEQCLVYCLDRPGPGKDHSACSATKCLAYQINEEVYQTLHAEPGCDCEYVHCSQTQLAEILMDGSGSIPLVSQAEPARGSDGKLWVTLLSSKDKSGGRRVHRERQHARFVAISHVWSDGLGNNRENSIPLCQFRRLSALVSDLCSVNGQPQPVPFWFDTLCFPLSPPEAGDAALLRMRESYEDSDQVLVLDGYLLSAKSEGMSHTELLLRIFCSPWNRRLWTLQEGVLPHRLIFRFADHYVSSRHFTEKLSWLMIPLNQGRHITRNDLANEPMPVQSWQSLMDIRERESSELNVQFSSAVMKETLRLFPHHVVRILAFDLEHHYRLIIFILGFLLCGLNTVYSSIKSSGATSRKRGAPMTLHGAKGALTYRNTSVKADEPLCLGNLLGVEPSAVVQARGPEARMAVIWDSVFSQRNGSGSGHAMLLFAEGPRLSTPGLRWAPATLMDGQPIEFWGGLAPYLENPVKLPAGLLTAMPTVMIQAAELVAGVKFNFWTAGREKTNNYLVEWSDPAQMTVEHGTNVKSSNGVFTIFTMAPLEVNKVPSFHQGLSGVWLADVITFDREMTLGAARLIARVDVKQYSDNSVVVWKTEHLDKGPGFEGSPAAVIPKGKWLID